jgi:hypothetical protein
MMSGEAVASGWDSPARAASEMCEPRLRGWRWGNLKLGGASIWALCPALVRTKPASRMHISRNPEIPTNGM